MEFLWRLLGVALVLLSVLIPATPVACATAAVPAPLSNASTSTGVWGYFNDMLLDAPRGRVYLTDASTFDAQGVVVMNATTHAVVSRFPQDSTTGLALSPNGHLLAVATDFGFVDLIDPDTWQVVRQISVPSDGISNGYLWSVAFYTDFHLFVTLGQPGGTVGGTHSAYVFNATTGAVEGGMSEGIYGFYANAVVRIDSVHKRAYVIDTAIPTTVWAYNLTNVSNITHINAWDVNAGTDSVLSPDGTRFYTSLGEVWDPLNFTLLRTTGDAGSPWVGSAPSALAYALANRIDLVSPSTYVLLGRYAYGGTKAGFSMTPLVIDPALRQAFVVSGSVSNYGELRVVPLVPGFVDPNPPEGSVVSVWTGISAFANGGVEPASLSMSVDNASVAFAYDSASLAVYYAPLTFPDGDHQVRLGGRDPLNQTVSLVWTFNLDTQSPQISLNQPNATYRTSPATVYARVADPHLNASLVFANGAKVIVNPANGSVAVPMTFREGGNPLTIVAYDTIGHQSSSSFTILYVPPTTRYVNATLHYSLEYPSEWVRATDLNVSGTHVDLSLQAPATLNGTPNMDLIAGGALGGYAVSNLLSVVNRSLATLALLPSFRLLEAPHATSIENTTAVTYTFSFGLTGSYVFERQYLIANASLRATWIVTFAAPYGDAARYDPLFRWIAESIRPYALPAPPGSDSPWLLLGILVAAAGAVAAAAIVLWMRRRRPRTQAPPPQAGPAAEAPKTAEEPLRPPGPGPP